MHYAARALTHPKALTDAPFVQHHCRAVSMRPTYELNAHDMKKLLDSKKSYKLNMDSFNQIRELSAKMGESG